MKLTVTLFRDADGVFVVECPSIPGCVSQGQDEEEALRNIRDANPRMHCGSCGTRDADYHPYARS